MIKQIMIITLSLFILPVTHAESTASKSMSKQKVYSILKSQIENDPSIGLLSSCIGKTPEETRKALLSTFDSCWSLAPDTFSQTINEKDMAPFASCYEKGSIAAFNKPIEEIEACVGSQKQAN